MSDDTKQALAVMAIVTFAVAGAITLVTSVTSCAKALNEQEGQTAREAIKSGLKQDGYGHWVK